MSGLLLHTVTIIEVRHPLGALDLWDPRGLMQKM